MLEYVLYMMKDNDIFGKDELTQKKNWCDHQGSESLVWRMYSMNYHTDTIKHNS